MTNGCIVDESLWILFEVDETGELVNCANLPDFYNEYFRELVKQLKPTTSDELVKIVSISHGTGSWIEQDCIMTH